MLKRVRNALGSVFERLLPAVAKRRAEMKYWGGRYHAEEGTLRNDHYEGLYTLPFHLSRNDYTAKRVLDIGCGPRGSLEWADGSTQRVGLDPLVPDYRRFGIDQHKMEYCAASSDKIPFSNGHFDIVTSLNALDHVDDFERTVSEIKRVTKEGGLFLVTVEIDHPPTAAEPIALRRSSFEAFRPEFSILQEELYGMPPDHSMRAAVTEKTPHEPGRPGWYLAKMVRAT